MFVESGLGIRVKFDMGSTVYLTVTAEHFATTRGLCGLYNNNADGKRFFSAVFFFLNALLNLTWRILLLGASVDYYNADVLGIKQ